ncbi:MAG: transposase [Planctomycetia bacterium]|nr:transposase [Planctomycetia bacterium]
MVAGFHLIWTAYGWWLPNDPRGSSSTEIRVERIAELGELHTGRKPIQPPRVELRRFYAQARQVLKHPLLMFSDEAIKCIGAGFARVVAERKYTCYACAVMPDHVHVLIRKHRDHAETMIANLQQGSRDLLIADGWRLATHPVWGGPGWKVFLYDRDDFVRIIDYIWQNPIKIGRPPQTWSFVKPYDGWLPGRYV